MAPRKPQTEKKAKGLIKGVGDYKGKTLNLTKKQLGKTGTAAAKKRTVNISNTKYDTGSKKVLGPAGKPLTGKVDLGGGNMAVYKDGVRVRAAAKKATPKSNTGGSSGGGSGSSGGNGKKNNPPKKTTLTGPMIAAGVRNNYTNNSATYSNSVSANIRERTPKTTSNGSWPAGTVKGPAVGHTKKMGGKTFRWNGSRYVEVKTKK